MEHNWVVIDTSGETDKCLDCGQIREDGRVYAGYKDYQNGKPLEFTYIAKDKDSVHLGKVYGFSLWDAKGRANYKFGWHEVADVVLA